jgi:hypothetical protein
MVYHLHDRKRDWSRESYTRLQLTSTIVPPAR